MCIFRKRAIQRGLLAAMLTISGGAAVPAAVDDLLITEVDPANDVVEVTNTSSVGFTTAADLPFSHLLDETSAVPNGTNFAGGESKSFTVTGLDDTAGDIWLYRDTDFTNPASIINGIQYGSGGDFGRTSVAVSAGVWPSSGDFVPLPGVGDTMQAASMEPFGPGEWIDRAPTVDAFFGTGVAFTNPLPNPIIKGTRTIELELVLDNVPSPLKVIPQPDGADRLYIYDQTGFVTLIDEGTVLPTPFLDVSSQMVTLQTGFDERGLIGFALHPDFPATPNVYTYASEPEAGTPDFDLPGGATGPNHHAVIAEWELDGGNPDVVDMSSKRELLRIAQPQFNHNGGTMFFGPDDGYLYIALGDGGMRDDFGNGHVAGGNAQDPESVLGSILRIDVDGEPGNAASGNGEYFLPADNPFVGMSGADEIYAYGLRNPWIFSFDRGTGTMYAADVGQGDMEEVNVIVNGGNYGWPFKEGSFFFDQNGSNNGFLTSIPVSVPPPAGTHIDPLAEYDHQDGISIIGGYVYRGATVSPLSGMYICGDFSTGFGSPAGRLFALDLNSNEFEELVIGNDDRALGLFLKGFGEDSDGELYVCGSTNLGPTGTTGVVYKIVPAPTNVDRWFLY